MAGKRPALPAGGARPNALLAGLKRARTARRGSPSPPAPGVRAGAGAGAAGGSLRVLTWNVWFNEHEGHAPQRMAALGTVVEAEAPDVVALQEVTPSILRLLRACNFARAFEWSPPPPDMPYFAMLLTRQGLRAGAFERRPFRDSQQGRDLVLCPVDAGGHRLRVATAHLESYVPGNPNSGERQAQLSHALAALEGEGKGRGGGGAILAGDLNWNERTEGAMALGSAWRDSWREACGDAAGFTYDCRENPMLGGTLRLRLDRVLHCLGAGARVLGARMVGREPIPGACRDFRRRDGTTGSRLLLPSDHFGLVTDLGLGERPAGGPSAGIRLGRAAPPGSAVEVVDLDSP